MQVRDSYRQKYSQFGSHTSFFPLKSTQSLSSHEKHPRFRVEADSLRRELNTNLNLDIRSLRLLNVYDLFGFSRELLEKSRYSVFGEVVTDSVTDSCDLAGRKYIAVEYLPGQFDQRAASAVDCVRLIDPSAQVRIRSSKLLLFDDAVSDEDLARIRHYYINAVESREKNLDVLTDMEQAEVKPVAVLEGFTKMTDAELEPCCKRYGLAMNADDLREVVKYFRAEGRDPYETELRILDTYWSDHCRHTTFTTELEGITVEESFAKDEIEDSLALYLRIRRLPFAAYADIAAPAIPLFHAFGRIGCFLGGCCYGIPWEGGITYTRALSPEANGVARFPVQLLESALLFALFFLLAALFRRGALRAKLLALYLAVYAVLRFLLEFLRGDAIRGVYFGLSTSQWISLAILLALGVAALARACARRRARASA